MDETDVRAEASLQLVSVTQEEEGRFGPVPRCHRTFFPHLPKNDSMFTLSVGNTH